MVTEFVVRRVDGAELRTASTVFEQSMQGRPPSDEKWEYLGRSYELSRVWGAFAGGELVGTTMSWDSSLALPGGATLPMAAVTGVGVRADHRRLGVLTELMREQLTASARAGEVFAGLRASEPVIYGRFGYGIGTLARTTWVSSKGAALRPEVPRSGQVRLLDAEQAIARLPEIYDRIVGHRPGMIGRTAAWWQLAYPRQVRVEHVVVAAHLGPDGHDGFVTYNPKHDNGSGPYGRTTLVVHDFQAADQGVANDLWRHLLSEDLVDEVMVYIRPVDEPLEPMLVDQQAVRTQPEDELWLRLVDVPAALAGRAYADVEPIIIEVRDPMLPANSGRYLVGPQGTRRTDEPAGLTMDVAVLAMIYLGAYRPSALAGIGRIEVADQAALPRADRLFATEVSAWCGTLF